MIETKRYPYTLLKESYIDAARTILINGEYVSGLESIENFCNREFQKQANTFKPITAISEISITFGKIGQENLAIGYETGILKDSFILKIISNILHEERKIPHRISETEKNNLKKFLSL